MRLNGTLPSLQNDIPNALQLQRQIARAVGAVQVRANRSKTIPASSAKLASLFTAAAAQLTLLAAKVRTLVITPGTVTVTVAAPTVQLVVTATAFDGTTANVAATSTYVSSNPAVATVSGTGLVTRVANGTATVTATYKGVPAEKLVTATA